MTYEKKFNELVRALMAIKSNDLCYISPRAFKLYKEVLEELEREKDDRN